jgi:hypothetical protein
MFVIGAPESYVPSADEVQLSNLVMDYWTRFAAKGDPNRPHAFRWPRYTADDLILEAGCDSGAAGGLPQPAMRLYRAHSATLFAYKISATDFAARLCSEARGCLEPPRAPGTLSKLLIG